ncbi:MAG: hypothetical protein KatS3mg002_1385 [Candidatus Woesearchaeota archaeon]|nr:MAG: hypothetical protein KatS3mg002_1385 [Candidatus Woesearchaeota archaeon]
MIKRLRSFNWWNEIFSILLAVFIYLLSPVIIIWLDNFQGKLIFTVFPQIQSMPAIWGISVTQRILFSFVGVLCANAFGWWMLKINHKKNLLVGRN